MFPTLSVKLQSPRTVLDSVISGKSCHIVRIKELASVGKRRLWTHRCFLASYVDGPPLPSLFFHFLALSSPRMCVVCGMPLLSALPCVAFVSQLSHACFNRGKKSRDWQIATPRLDCHWNRFLQIKIRAFFFSPNETELIKTAWETHIVAIKK